MTTPVLPFVHVSSDATVQATSVMMPKGANNNSSQNVSINYLSVGVDSANRIFLLTPNYQSNGVIYNTWFVLDNTANNYPVGEIEDINCSYTYNGVDCIIRLIVLAAGRIYEFVASTSTPGAGNTTYVWRDITPPISDAPNLPNPF